jgi:hypothetical protein
VTVAARTDLQIGLEVDGVVVIPPGQFPAPEKLSYVDTVIKFSAGPDPDANVHADPQAVLGAPGAKPADRFVALGGGGRLTVGFAERDIVATGGNDVIVFVHPQDDQRRYRVEAFSVPARRWLPIGESIGVTQGFDLAVAGLNATRGIRIIDTSGRVIGPDRLPLSAPGVAVAAVGVRRVRPHRRYFGQWCWCCRWLLRVSPRFRDQAGGQG